MARDGVHQHRPPIHLSIHLPTYLYGQKVALVLRSLQEEAQESQKIANNVLGLIACLHSNQAVTGRYLGTHSSEDVVDAL
jgi:hypothetical protein